MLASTTYSSNNELEINGRPFKKVHGPACSGDFIIYEEAPYSYLTANVPYLVRHNIDGDTVVIVDDDGDVYDTYRDDFSIYRLKGKV
ncbi:hypothetical protein K7Q68_001794 [Listeria monocytogenes]|nr:hypothetical protein [Listeria monocytogenes]